MQNFFLSFFIFASSYILFFYNLSLNPDSPDNLSPILRLTFTSKKKPSLSNHQIPIFVSGKLSFDGTIQLKQAKIPDNSLLMLVPSFSIWRKSVSVNFVRLFSASLEKIQADNPSLKGFVFDAEFDSRQLKSDYTELVCKIYQQTKNKNANLQFYLALFPPNHPDQHGHYDWSQLMQCSDYWILMFYDEQSPRTKEGPVSTSVWIQKNLDTVDEILLHSGKKNTDSKADKDTDFIRNIRKRIILGLPLYGYGNSKRGIFGKVHPIKNWNKNEKFLNSRDDYIKIQAQDENIFLPTAYFIKQWNENAINLGYAGVAYWRAEFTTKCYFSSDSASSSDCRSSP